MHLKDMLRQVIFLTLLDFSSSSINQQECYGSNYKFTPMRPTFSIYFQPRTAAKRSLVVQDGVSKHERFEASVIMVKLKALTEQDDGAVLSFDYEHEDVELTITDCSQSPETMPYKGVFSWRIPSDAKYLQFARVVPDRYPEKSVVIWNRTRPASTPSRVTTLSNYFKLNDLTQKDSGYYKFRGSNNELLKWKRLIVEACSRYFEHFEEEDFDMEFPFELEFSHINFLSSHSGYELTIKNRNMQRRMEVHETYFVFRELKYEDSGTYEFIDNEGNVAIHLELNVMFAEIPTYTYVIITVGIVFGVIICCCCVKKCCCKKSSSKRNSNGSAEAASLPVFYHDSNQAAPSPVTPIYRNPLPNTENTTIDNAAVSGFGPTASTQPTVLGDGPTSLITTSFDSEPRFEFKASVFPSAPPLCSDSSIENVYTSDKLNFL